MKKLIIVIVLFWAVVPITAQTKTAADEAYQSEDYEKAIEMYDSILAKTPDADIYYNLGNAYFRLDSIACAILAYERALKLKPGDEDARFNLQVANSKTVDKLSDTREMFFVTWYHSVSGTLSADTWAIIAIVLLLMAALALLLYFVATSESVRKLTFYSSLAALFLFVLCNLFAWQQQKDTSAKDFAIVIAQQANVMSTPSVNGTKAFTLHSGTKVHIDDDTLTDWKQITLSDGRQGWIDVKTIELI